MCIKNWPWMKGWKSLLYHLPSEPLLSPNKVTLLIDRIVPSPRASQTVSSAQDLNDQTGSFLSSRVRPLPLFPGSLLPLHLSIFFSDMFPTSPPTFDYSGCFRTYRRQECFFIKSECSSPREVQMPKISTKKDFDKLMDEKTSGL